MFGPLFHTSLQRVRVVRTQDAQTQTESPPDAGQVSPELPMPLQNRDQARARPEDFGPTARERAAGQRRTVLQQRRVVDSILEKLQHGEGAPPFRPDHPLGACMCWRLERGVFELRPHDAFLGGEDIGLALHLHGSGLMVRQDGSWLEQPDTAFFAALDTAWRAGDQSFAL